MNIFSLCEEDPSLGQNSIDKKYEIDNLLVPVRHGMQQHVAVLRSDVYDHGTN